MWEGEKHKNILTLSCVCIIIFNYTLYFLQGSWIELLKSINQITICYNTTNFHRIHTEFSMAFICTYEVMSREKKYANSSYKDGNERIKS